MDCGETTMDETISSVLAKPTTSPVTPTEMKAAGHIVRRIMQESSSSGEGVVHVKTRGQVSKIVNSTQYLTITNKINTANYLGASCWV